MTYGRIYGDFFLTRFGYYPPPIALSRSRYSTGKKRFLDKSTDFVVLSSATTPPPDVRLAVFRARPSEPLRLRRVKFFGYYPKSQDFFPEFRLGNPETH